jgi:hypothetical protein
MAGAATSAGLLEVWEENDIMLPERVARLLLTSRAGAACPPRTASGTEETMRQVRSSLAVLLLVAACGGGDGGPISMP